MVRFAQIARAALFVGLAMNAAVEAATTGAAQTTKTLGDLGGFVVVPYGCTPIYPADVVGKSYRIVLPGRYCLVGKLDASRPVVKATTPADMTSASASGTAAVHTGAAIHVQASGVEIDFRGYSLNERTRGTIADGVRIDPALEDVNVHGGTITGFAQGIGLSSGIPQASNITVRKMTLTDGEAGVSFFGVRDSLVTQNTIAAKLMGIGLSAADNVVVSANDVTISTTTVGWGLGIYTSWGLRNVAIIENVVKGRGLASTTGIHLHNNSHTATAEEMSRDSRVDGNKLYGVEAPIVVAGTGVGTNNTVRNNQIFGMNESFIIRTFPASFAGRFTAIAVSSNIDIEVASNTILSGPTLAYYNGIKLSWSTVKLDGAGQSTLRFNQVCGVADPLVPPTGVAESTIDGGSNFWNTGFCSPPVVQ